MTYQEREQMKEQIETLIDKSPSLKEFILMLSDICCDKAVHIECNWQDNTLAKEWEKMGRKIERLSYRAKV